MTVPSVSFSADEGVPLGSVVEDGGEHQLHVDLDGLPAGAVVSLVSSSLDAPEVIGTADDGSLTADRTVTRP